MCAYPHIHIIKNKIKLLLKIGWKASGFHLRPGADPVPKMSIPKFLQERTGLPGVLTHRLAGGTSHSQR